MLTGSREAPLHLEEKRESFPEIIRKSVPAVICKSIPFLFLWPAIIPVPASAFAEGRVPERSGRKDRDKETWTYLSCIQWRTFAPAIR